MRLVSGDRSQVQLSVSSKRISRENKSKRKERDQDRQRQVEENKEKPFEILVRAKSTRKRSSVHVKPEDVVAFYKELRDIMQQSMLFEAHGNKRYIKEREKYAEENEERDQQMQPVKNRKERRKEIKKERKKTLRQTIKRQQLLEAEAILNS